MQEIIRCSGIDLIVRTNTVDRENAVWMETSPFWNYLDASKLGPDATVIDLGAHVGSFAVATAVKCGCRVVAFEPEPGSFRLIQSNAALNGQTVRVTAHCAAVGGRTATIDFYESTETWGHTVIGLGGPHNKLTGQRFKVQCFSLADALAQADVTHCDFLKFNIEGAEHEMFACCDNSTLGRIDRMVGEVHFDLGCSDPDPFVKPLQASGFNTHIERANADRAYLYAWKPGLNGPPKPRKLWFWPF
jgi:FkbM family methyltransferase